MLNFISRGRKTDTAKEVLFPGFNALAHGSHPPKLLQGKVASRQGLPHSPRGRFCSTAL